MNEEHRQIVMGQDGVIGWVDLSTQPEGQPECSINLDDGQTLMIPTNWLQEQHDGTYFIPMNRSQLDAAAWTQVVSNHANPAHPEKSPNPITDDQDVQSNRDIAKQWNAANEREGRFGEVVEEVIPVVQEEAVITKREVIKGGVKINKHVSQREETVNAHGMVEEIIVERVAVGKMIEQNPGVRYEGETMIIPVLEEVLVVEKRLRLKEEVRVTKHLHSVDQPQTVHLRTEEIDVERLEP